MSVKTLFRALEICQAAGRPAFIWGTQGNGKSEIVEQMAAQMGIGFCVKHLAQVELGDIIGMGTTMEEEGEIVTTNAIPRWLPRENSHTPERGILLLDEFNRINEVEMRAMFQFILTGELHEYRLPKGWYIAAAGNPMTENFFVRGMDMAMLSRFVHLKLEPSFQDWHDWALVKGIDMEVVEFLKVNKKYFAPTGDLGDDFLNDIKLQPCPRTWEHISQLLAHMKKEDWMDDNGAAAMIFEGTIGTESGLNFIKYLRKLSKLKPLSGEDIIYKLDKKKSYIDKITEPGAVRLDILEASMFNLKNFVKSKSVPMSDCLKIADFLILLPEDMMLGVIKEWRTDPQLKKILVEIGAKNEKLTDKICDAIET